MIFAEEYARARAPARLGHLGVELLGPTILAFGTEAQKARFLPPHCGRRGVLVPGLFRAECGFGPAERPDPRPARAMAMNWVIDGQKTWTSLAQFADWVFLVCRTSEGSRGRDGLSFLLVPMKQPGVTRRPIRQMTGDVEFNELFFDGARTGADYIVGAPGDGWQVAMALLASSAASRPWRIRWHSAASSSACARWPWRTAVPATP